MDDDLRGLDFRPGPHGVKRARSEMSDGESSDDEPEPKRDRLLEELCDLQSINQSDQGASEFEKAEDRGAALVQDLASFPEDQHIPLRLHRQTDETPGKKDEPRSRKGNTSDETLDKSQAEGGPGRS